MLVATGEPVLDPSTHRASLDPESTRNLVDRVAAVNLDELWIELPPLARFHDASCEEAGLALPSRVAATRPATHAHISVASQPTAFVDNWIGVGKLPAATSRYSDERLSPVVCWTSRRRMMRSRAGSNWIGETRLLRMRAFMEPAGQAAGRLDLDGFISAVLGSAGMARTAVYC